MNLDKITDIHDLQKIARRRVPRMFYDYADSGAWSESTYRDNTDAFSKIMLRQRVARNIDNRTVATTMVGQDVSMPVALAPVGMTGMQHADGEIHAARAAEKFGVPFTPGERTVKAVIGGEEFDLVRTVTTRRWTFVVDKDGKIAMINSKVKAAEDSKAVMEAISQLD